MEVELVGNHHETAVNSLLYKKSFEHFKVSHTKAVVI